MKNKLVIFDLDGVLINSLSNMKFALLNTQKKMNIKLNFNVYKKYLGLPFENIMKKGKMPGNLMSTMLVRGFLYSFSSVFFLLIFRQKKWSKWYWFYLFSQLHKTFLHRRKKFRKTISKVLAEIPENRYFENARG